MFHILELRARVTLGPIVAGGSGGAPEAI